MKRVYLAGPFFNDEQKAVMASARKALEAAGLKVIDPQELSPVIVDLPEEQRSDALFEAIFRRNVEGVEGADAVFACIDWKDTGTSFEIGLAFGKGVPIYTFSASGKSCNVMLARSAHGHLPDIASAQLGFRLGERLGSFSGADE